MNDYDNDDDFVPNRFIIDETEFPPPPKHDRLPTRDELPIPKDNVTDVHIYRLPGGRYGYSYVAHPPPLSTTIVDGRATLIACGAATIIIGLIILVTLFHEEIASWDLPISTGTSTPEDPKATPPAGILIPWD
ncbi:hypothetical protein [Corynebacterium uterequi]|uniref:Uncharacterized protein n=1 Tax=Corynebacterium uterequi TaxID=1072256 RepID=A0A0G3HEY8_9CORY|nr:hypothetical protein [Corynebacterium uterequi]AKK11869.1 hypothetical protein CUTER_09505 [Corynebacterium uterequi]